MGAAASTDTEKEELRAAFAAYGGYEGNSTSTISNSEFESLLSSNAPTVHGKLSSTGNVSAAALALRDQFDSAKRKMNANDSISPNDEPVGRSSGEASPAGVKSSAGGDAENPARSQQLATDYPLWAASKEANLQYGLIRGMLRSCSLNTVRFVVGAASQPLSPKSPTPSPPAGPVHVGSEAQVTGLVAKPEINGSLVTVVAFDESKQRFRVTFLPQGVKTGLLKPENLIPVQNPANKIEAPSLTALIDTGAERSAMSPAAATRSGLAPALLDSSFSRTVGGVGSATGFGRIHFASISLPDAKIESSPMLGLFDCSFDVFEWPPSSEFDAILGLDFLLRYRAVLDLQQGVVRLVAESDQEVLVAMSRPTAAA